MNKYFSTLVIFLFLMLQGSSSLWAQQTYKQGKLVLKIVEVEMADQNNAKAAKMMEGKKIKIYFTPDKQRTDISMMGGMARMSIIADAKDTNSVVLMKMMGQKMKMTIGEQMADRMSGGGEGQLPDDLKIVHQRDKTKIILDFNTHEVDLSYTGEDGKPVLMKYYVTDEIITPKAIASQLPKGLDLGGVPLEYEIVMPGKGRMKYKAVEFGKLSDSSVFDIPEDYQEIDPAMLGGMGH